MAALDMAQTRLASLAEERDAQRAEILKLKRALSAATGAADDNRSAGSSTMIAAAATAEAEAQAKLDEVIAKRERCRVQLAAAEVQASEGGDDADLHRATVVSLQEELERLRREEASAREALRKASAAAQDYGLLVPAVEAIRREEYADLERERKAAVDRSVAMEGQIYRLQLDLENERRARRTASEQYELLRQERGQFLQHQQTQLQQQAQLVERVPMAYAADGLAALPPAVARSHTT